VTARHNLRDEHAWVDFESHAPHWGGHDFDQRGFSHSLEMTGKKIDEKQASHGICAVCKSANPGLTRLLAAFRVHL